MKTAFKHILIAALLLPTTAFAQEEAAVEDVAQTAYERMLESTQKVLIVDSLVVPEGEFLSNIPLPADCGRIERTEDGVQFINEFEDYMLYTVAGVDGNKRIFSRNKSGGEWTESKPVKVLGAPSDYPFMTGDGVTLYFSHRGSGSIGGYDIFVTRFDDDENTFLKPQNIGFPFNSEANDYLYVVDEIDSIGWFVTDRNQPKGYVCIYTFVPAALRENYDITTEGAETVRSRAAITSIKDTWKGNEEALEQARERLTSMAKRKQKQGRPEMFFPINDDVVYTSMADFQVKENVKRMERLKDLQQQAEEDGAELEEMRVKYYRSFRRQERENLGTRILIAEKKREELLENIEDLKLRIRNAEIKNMDK